MVLYPAVCRTLEIKSDLGERSLLTYCDVLTRTLPFCFVSIEIKTIYLEYIQQCFPLYFICKS